ncbi:MAG: tripartite tricarboxylate transporter substrate binding protein [Burkholderiales bacterium]|nr:tripartite tricarboxylate transporter substrate binding protein [Burkholderiales bacterium]
MVAFSARQLVAAATALNIAALGLAAHAQAFPNKPMRIVVGFPAGGATDIVARAIGQNLNQAFNQPVIVDNRPGAASNIGADHVAKSPPDGYTLFMGSISLANNATLYSKLPYDALRDFAAVVHVTNTAFMLCVHPSVPVKKIQELTAFAKARAGQVQYGTAGNGSGAHLFTELYRSMAGIQLQSIPYKGAAPALSDLLGGQVAFVFDNIISMVPLHKSGKIRCLATSSKTRAAIAPDIPTMHEAGIRGYEADAWFGLFAPAGTPSAAIERINTEVNRALQVPGIKHKFEALGCEPVGGTAAQFGAYFRAEIDKWGKVIRAANIRLE